MRSDNEQTNGLEGASYKELRLLEEVSDTPDLSQRQLAHRLGVALGVTNLLVRRMAANGYIKASQLGWRRWIYVLTPRGAARKVHLTLAYIDRFFEHYRRVRTSLRDELGVLPLNEESRVAIYGTTEFAEMVFMALRDLGVTDIEFFDRDSDSRRFLGTPVMPLDSMVPAEYSRVVVAASTDLQAKCEELRSFGVPTSDIVLPVPNSRELFGDGGGQAVEDIPTDGAEGNGMEGIGK